MTGSSTVKSAERLLDVLNLLSRLDRPVTAMYISSELEIPRSSAYHLLNVMKERNFVTHRSADGTWELGVGSLEVGLAYLRSGSLQRAARVVLPEIAARSGQTAHLAILQGTEVLYIDKEAPPGMGVQLVTSIGTRLPAHLTAVGRAILAYLPEQQLRALYGDDRLPPMTDTEGPEVERLLQDLAVVAESGFASDEGMITEGISCLAVPVLAPDRAPAAAIGLTFLTAQVDADEEKRLSDLLTGAAGELARAAADPDAEVMLAEEAVA